MTLSVSQVDALAPDDASRKAGRQLAAPARWTAACHRDQLAWGACAGSGKSPYGVQVDVSANRWKCTCPSRKQPCKHVLALLYLLADGRTADAEVPGEVASWAARRAASPAPATKTGDAAKAKRLAAVTEAVGTLQHFLDRVAASGLVNVSGAERAQVARRLVDSKAAGLAAELSDVPLSGDASVDGFARLHIAARLWSNRDGLPPVVRAELDSYVGLPLSFEPLPSGRWWSPGSETGVRGKLTWRRTWLADSDGRAAYQLDWGPATSPAPVAAGWWFDAQLSGLPDPQARVKVEEPSVVAPVGPAAGLGCREIADRFAATLAANPLAQRAAFPFRGALTAGERWLLRDMSGIGVELDGRP